MLIIRIHLEYNIYRLNFRSHENKTSSHTPELPWQQRLLRFWLHNVTFSRSIIQSCIGRLTTKTSNFGQLHENNYEPWREKEEARFTWQKEKKKHNARDSNSKSLRLLSNFSAITEWKENKIKEDKQTYCHLRISKPSFERNTEAAETNWSRKFSFQDHNLHEAQRT